MHTAQVTVGKFNPVRTRLKAFWESFFFEVNWLWYNVSVYISPCTRWIWDVTVRSVSQSVMSRFYLRFLFGLSRLGYSAVSQKKNTTFWITIFTGYSLSVNLHLLIGIKKNWTLVKDQFSHLVYLNICIHIANLWKLELNYWLSKLRDNNERTNTFVTWSRVLSGAWFRDLKF